nr:N-acetylmuramic acid 6-phosphate etherase [uncultured Albidiferax sp.]
MLSTESTDITHTDLDLYPTDRLVATLIDDQYAAAMAVRAAAADISRAVEATAKRLSNGGRLIYVGAGSSGRLGWLDGNELAPTFSWPVDRVICLLAGGEAALSEAVEGAEDDREDGAKRLRDCGVRAEDVVLIVAASGRTPFAIGALNEARAHGALTVGIVNNQHSPIAAAAELSIVLDTGPEVIAGSTRLKAGTAQKIALNTLSSATMVRLHKVYRNQMVDMHPTNEKLFNRAIRMTELCTGVNEEQARAALQSSDFQVKVAVVSLCTGVDIEAAKHRLNASNGNVRQAIGI